MRQLYIERSTKGECYLVFGGYNAGDAGFKPEELAAKPEPPVWETVGVTGFHKTAESFDEWLERRAASARKRYKKKDWRAIVQGPAPFSAAELAIVKARSKFRMRLLGVTPTGALRFEVSNNSDRRLPYLSIGLRSPDMEGGAWLDIGTIGPGTTGVVEHAGYSEITDPHTVEAFPIPEPEPEDRDRYWEFRT